MSPIREPQEPVNRTKKSSRPFRAALITLTSLTMAAATLMDRSATPALALTQMSKDNPSARTVAASGGCDIEPGQDKVYCPDLPGTLYGELRMSAYWAAANNSENLIAGLDDRRMRLEPQAGDIKEPIHFATASAKSDGTGYLLDKWNQPVTGAEPTSIILSGNCDAKADFFNIQKNRIENTCALPVRDIRISSTDGRTLEDFGIDFVRLCPKDEMVPTELYQFRTQDGSYRPGNPVRQPLHVNTLHVTPR